MILEFQSTKNWSSVGDSDLSGIEIKPIIIASNVIWINDSVPDCSAK